MTTKQTAYKFIGGVISGGGVALLAFLVDKCQINDWNAFISAALLAAASGAFHVAKNLKTTS